MTWQPGHLRWAVLRGETELDTGTVPDVARHADQVALDALADFAGRHGVHPLQMAGLTAVVTPDGWESVVLAVADGRDW